jgi:hypothetical protein
LLADPSLIIALVLSVSGCGRLSGTAAVGRASRWAHSPPTPTGVALPELTSTRACDPTARGTFVVGEVEHGVIATLIRDRGSPVIRIVVLSRSRSGRVLKLEPFLDYEVERWRPSVDRVDGAIVANACCGDYEPRRAWGNQPARHLLIWPEPPSGSAAESDPAPALDSMRPEDVVEVAITIPAVYDDSGVLGVHRIALIRVSPVAGGTPRVSVSAWRRPNTGAVGAGP